MKQIINGKTYNTETAEEIADWDNLRYPGDFRYVNETLYLTKKGAWFLFGEGGPLSSYAKSCGNGWTGSSKIRPLSRREAYAWLEEHEMVEVIETRFSDMIEEA